MKNKRLFLTFIIIINVLLLKAQDSVIDIHFANNDWKKNITIDSSNPNNIWQIGKVSKKIFKSGFWDGKALITDTSKVYPINNKSVVYITPNFPHSQCNYMWLIFEYKFDSDSLKDYGLFDMSIDGGKTWIDLLKDSIYTYSWSSSTLSQPHMPNNRPIFTGRITDWAGVQLNFNKKVWYENIILRFTFISDSIQTKKEGWMIGAFTFIREMYISSIDETSLNDDIIKIYPNPVYDFSIIDFGIYKENISQLIISDLYGKIIKQIEKPKENFIIKKQDFYKGIYLVNIILNDNTKFTKKIIIL